MKKNKENKTTEEEKRQKIEKATLSGATVNVINRYGSAIKEHLVAFNGVDNENNKKVKRSLKSISKSKVNARYKKSNIKQQAGFSAEIKISARENAEHIISGDRRRTTRTDDIEQTVTKSGVSVGGTNDQLFDIAQLSENGEIIEESLRQVKFVGGTPKQCCDRLLDHKFDKYRDNNAKIEIPKDFYKDVKRDLDERTRKLQEQIDKAKNNGDKNLVNSKTEELKKVKKTRESIVESNVTNKEAIEARLHPVQSTAKDVLKLANRAGLEQAKIGAGISGVSSVIRNTVLCIQGKKEPEEAAIDVLKDTSKGALFSYKTAFAGATVKGLMQNSSQLYTRTLSKTTLPSIIVSSAENIGKNMLDLLKGEKDVYECIGGIAEESMGQLGGAMFSTVATSAVSGQVTTLIAGALGSTVGYAAAVAVYKELSTAIKEYNLAREERIQTETVCAELVEMICQYRLEMNEQIESTLLENISAFTSGFDALDKSIAYNDSDGFISGNAIIQKKLGHVVQFSNQEEFDNLMMSNEDFIL